MNEGEYQLKDPEELKKRIAMLDQPHMTPLSIYLQKMKTELGSGYDTPMFDPCDGGINAKALFLLEAPGPKAVGSGFISRNNPDPSAKNFNKLLLESGFNRREILLWNIVPWYVGSGKKIRPVRMSDIDQATPFLKELLSILSKLRVIILVGIKAQSARSRISNITELPIVNSYHPSNLSLNSDPNRYSDILKSLYEAQNITNACSPNSLVAGSS
jgi:uracil-DNA glycosylase